LTFGVLMVLFLAGLIGHFIRHFLSGTLIRH